MTDIHIKKSRTIADTRNKDQMFNDALARLHRGRLTVSEYNEVHDDIKLTFFGYSVNTISEKVKDFMQMYGVHIEPQGIGWNMTWY